LGNSPSNYQRDDSDEMHFDDYKRMAIETTETKVIVASLPEFVKGEQKESDQRATEVKIKPPTRMIRSTLVERAERLLHLIQPLPLRGVPILQPDGAGTTRRESVPQFTWYKVPA
jgi:hypothetical protein